MKTLHHRASEAIPGTVVATPVWLAVGLLMALALLLGLVQVLTEQMHRAAAWRHQFQVAVPNASTVTATAGHSGRQADVVLSSLALPQR